MEIERIEIEKQTNGDLLVSMDTKYTTNMFNQQKLEKEAILLLLKKHLWDGIYE